MTKAMIGSLVRPAAAAAMVMLLLSSKPIVFAFIDGRDLTAVGRVQSCGS